MLLGLVLSENADADAVKLLKQSLPSGGFYDVAGEKTHSEHLNTQTVCAQNQIRACQKDQTLMLLTSSELGNKSIDLGRLDHIGDGGGVRGEFLAGVSSWTKVQNSEIMT